MRLTTHDLLTQQFDSLKETYFGSSSIILHRREIISASPPFDSLKDEKVRNRFNRDLLAIISDLRYGVISVVIDKKSLVDKYGLIKAKDPYALGLEYLMQRYQYWLQDASMRYGPIKGDILAEARGGKEDTTTKQTYRYIYEGQGYNSLDNADRYYSSREIKLKKKKDNIAGLQFVDLISHPARRFILSENGLASNLKKTSFEQTIVEILVSKKFRRGKNGVIDGYGTVLFPKK